MESGLKVAELFAGVGGFRIGFERASSFYDFVYANQWEPGTKTQDAANVYASHFDNLDNTDISKVNEKDIPKMDVLVGGFPCQDYSVAGSSMNAKGIVGKKGVLFWDIMRIVREHQPNYCVFENVDRLLKSPSSKRGKDFGIMLQALTDEGYRVQWRAITSSDYGYPQRRKRVYILATKRESDAMYKYLPIAEKLEETTFTLATGENMYEQGYTFLNSGECVGKEVTTWKSVAAPVESYGVLGDILEEEVAETFYYTEAQVERFKYLRGPKKVEREKNGISYVYSEGTMSETDSLEKPSRTMTTSEGNISRQSHIILVNGRKRRITPKECERLNGFPDDWSALASNRKRYFFMGNALVIGIVERIAKGIMDEAKVGLSGTNVASVEQDEQTV